MRRSLWVGGLALGIALADQVAKALVTSVLAVDTSLAPIPALDAIFSLTYVRNTGMALSLLRDSNAFLILVSLVMIGVLLVLYAGCTPRGRG
jgi:lipoprotein signal peptidase